MHVPFFSGGKLQVIPHPDLLCRDDVQSGEEVREGVLETKGDGQPAHAERRQDRGDGDPELVQDNQDSHPINDDSDDVLRDTRYGGGRLGSFRPNPGKSGQDVRRDQCHGEDGQDGQSCVRPVDEGFGNGGEFKGHINPEHEAEQQEGGPQGGDDHLPHAGIGLPRPSGKSGKEKSPQKISRQQDDDKDPEGKQTLHGFLNRFEERVIHKVHFTSFKGTACFSIQAAPSCLKAASISKRNFTVSSWRSYATSSHVTIPPAGTALVHPDLMGESDGEIPGSEGFAGRQEGPIDGGAAFSVQYVPGRSSFFAVAATSPVKSRADPVGSPRRATEATLMPSSRPIRWAGR